MLKQFFDKITFAKDSLTTIGKQEPLSKISLIIIIALDIFLYTFLMKGLSYHNSQLPAQSIYISNVCREMLVEKTWTAANILDELAYIIRGDYYNYEDNRNSKQEDCNGFEQKLEKIAQEKDLRNQFNKRYAIKEKLRSLNYEMGDLNNAYHISKEPDAVKTPNVDKMANQKAQEFDSNIAELQTIEKTLLDNENIKTLQKAIDDFPAEKRAELVSTIRYQNFYYPVRSVFWSLLYLLPPFIAAYFWNAYGLRREKDIHVFISSHILVVYFIPLLWEFFDLVSIIIPQRLLKRLWDMLVSLHLTAIWHYGVMVIVTAIALALVYLVQKKIFNRRKIFIKRLGNKVCYGCGNKLPEALPDFCPHCGIEYSTVCKNCGKKTYKSSCFCHCCGANKEESSIRQ